MCKPLRLGGNQLAVPEFEYLNGALLYAATTEGIKHPHVMAYVNSVLAFAAQTDHDGAADLEALRASLSTYQTTEAQLLQSVAPATAEISREDGLRLVLQACDRLEAQVFSLSERYPVRRLEKLSY